MSTDQPTAPHSDIAALEAQARISTAALVTYALIALWLITKVAVFAIAIIGAAHGGNTTAADVPAAMMALLGQIITTEQSLLVAAVGYWVGSSQSSKNAQVALTQVATAAVAQPKDGQ